MKYAIITILATALSFFFIWGAFYVNLENRNYFFFIYDIIMVAVVWYLRYLILVKI